MVSAIDSLSLGRGRPALRQLPPLALYVHLPWCLRKCPYCDFNSHEERGAVAEDNYLDALQADLEASLPLIWGRSVQTIFIGGGTPSLFSAQAIDRLLTMIRTRVRLVGHAEITMEANPGTFEAARFEGFAQAGVNRLSIGVQSFDDRRLQALGRVHDAAQARAAIELAARRFETFNIDLMYALPGQDLAGLRQDLQAALAFTPPHLSYYQLTLEPNTLFERFPPKAMPDEDLAARMQDEIEALTARAGLQHYEISAYARPGHRARHNLNYWEFGDYLGIGAGAHGKLSFHDRILRQARYKHPRRYMQALGHDPGGDLPRPAQAASSLAGEHYPANPFVEEERLLERADLPFEFMLNALRLTEGVGVGTFADRTGMSLAEISQPLALAAQRQLLDNDPTRLKATPLGARFLNDLQALFLPER